MTEMDIHAPAVHYRDRWPLLSDVTAGEDPCPTISANMEFGVYSCLYHDWKRRQMDMAIHGIPPKPLPPLKRQILKDLMPMGAILGAFALLSLVALTLKAKGMDPWKH